MVRPFSKSASVECRGYSLGLQRVLVDFGADESFKDAVKKVGEHYGIEVSESATRRWSEHHGAAMLEEQEDQRPELGEGGVERLVGQMDGSLIPMVTTSEAADRRKTRAVCWREARLALAHEVGSMTPRFGATLGGVEKAGDCFAICVAQTGGGQQTHLHCVSDGAVWIVEQIARNFGERADYLIDFYHVSQYLARAGEVIAREQSAEWRREQQEELRESHAGVVLEALKPYVEMADIGNQEAPVRSCYRYLSNRLEYLDYKRAIEQGLPIGSGEVESAHRYVIQKRLKIAGAWWHPENAAGMLALRVNRANGDWRSYWQRLRQAAI